MAVLFTIFLVDYTFYTLLSITARTYHWVKKMLDARKSGYNQDYLAPGTEPRVLVQLPMYNEETYAQAIIDKCCLLQWPKDKLCIQVVDDSTKPHIRELVDAAVASAVEAGYPVTRLRRENRQGFKAGAMKEALESIHGQYEYCAIFDADFTPPVDFLYRTVPRMEADAGIGFVQTRWTFESYG
jgi:beta-mannan synthase